METDQPISNLGEDKLSRETFVKALASEIDLNRTKECNVIGLYGKWGAGKTSIIKLLDEQLNKKYFFTSYFNPWRYKSEDVLLKELFLKILEGAKTDKKLNTKIEELGKLLDEYSQFISIPKISIWGLAFDFSNSAKGLAKGIGKRLKGNDSIDSKKKRINEVLGDLALPLVIFVDDVDRLDVNEIQSLFKLIKLTADFNNLIYVIAFDDEMVSKALAKNYGTGEVSDGKSFLEKIVQLPLRIPYVNEQERFEYSLSLLNEWVAKNSIILPDKYQSTFVQKFKGLHDNFIKTPRDSKRLINSVSFSHQCLKEEICVYDIILLETIRIFAPQVFEQLLEYKSSLFSKPSGQNGYTLHNDLRETGKSFQERISNYSEALPVIQGAIDFMFPSNDIFNVGWDTHRSESQQDLFKYQRVGIQKYFDRFVEFKISKQDISDSDFKEILTSVNTENYENLDSHIDILKKYPSSSIFTLLVHFKDQLSTIGNINVSIMLCTLEYFFKDTSVESRFFHRPTVLTLEILSKVPQLDRIATAKFIFENCERLNHVSFLAFRFRNGFGKEQENKFEPEDQLLELVKNFITNVQSNTIATLFDRVDDEKNDILFGQIEEFGKLEQLKSDLLEFINLDARNILLVMKSLISMSYYNFSSVGEYGDEISFDRFKAIEYYVPRETIESKCSEIYPGLNSNLPEGFLRGQEIETDKKIVIQYFRYLITEENKEKEK